MPTADPGTQALVHFDSRVKWEGKVPKWTLLMENGAGCSTQPKTYSSDNGHLDVATRLEASQNGPNGKSNGVGRGGTPTEPVSQPSAIPQRTSRRSSAILSLNTRRAVDVVVAPHLQSMPCSEPNQGMIAVFQSLTGMVGLG